MARRALLIGVDDYADDGLELKCVSQDLTALSAALARVGYPKAMIREQLSSQLSLSTATLRRIIKQFLGSCASDDEALVYFSGHGAEQGGHRMLIPTDYYLDEPRPAQELINDAHLYSLARDCAARSVLFVIDACREGVKLVLTKDSSLSGTSSGPASGRADSPTVAILYSCAKGELSRAGELSFFTDAFCRALKEDNNIATLSEVRDATQSELTKLLLIARLPAQTVSLDERPITGRAGDPYRLIVKENLALRTRQSIGDSAWCRMLTRSPYWKDLAEQAPGLADQINVMVLRAEVLAERASQQLPGQRWRDMEAPERVLRYLAMLCPADNLGPAEAAIALATPFVYEAVLAAGELLLLETSDPLNPTGRDPTSEDGRAWLSLRNAFFAHESFARRRKMLLQRGQAEAAQDLAAWQMLRFLHSSGEAWEYGMTGHTGWVTRDLQQLFAAGPFQSIADDDRVCRVLEGRRLTRFARLLFADFDDIELERGRTLNKELRFGEGANGWLVDEPALAHLISLSAKMAIDPRRLSSMLADHLGMTPEFTAASLRELLGNVEWHEGSDAISLTLECAHEVCDFVLEEQAGTAEAHRVQLRRESCLRKLPNRIDARNLRALVSPEGRPRYQKPHLRLTMDEVRVRELLMGKELYGEPTLALREMFQNALDACRHRRTRVKWLIAQKEEVEPYVGHISFKMGKHNGRTYVECRDNGIGMADRHLRRLFARAGQRFTDSHEFHLEKARWDEAGISFWSNSRFGIGVYSYFMLADEIHVETKRLKEDGIDTEDGLAATVGGSGSLFRLRAESAVQVGTRIRLYLNDGVTLENLHSSVLDWLWLPEFDTTLEELDGTTLTLSAGSPARQMDNAMGHTMPIPASADGTGRPRLFWSLKQLDNDLVAGALLTDGVLVERRHGDMRIQGLAINLTADLRPSLSVDRTRVTEWHVGEAWVRDVLLSEGWRLLPACPGANLQLLSSMLNVHPRPLLSLDKALREQTMGEARVPFDDSRNSSQIRLTGLGLSGLDGILKGLLAKEMTSPIDKTGTLPMLHKALINRLAALMRAGHHPSQVFGALATHAKADDDLPAGASVLLAQVVYDSQAKAARLPLSNLISMASFSELSLQEALELAAPLRGAGVLLPDVPAAMGTYRPDAMFARFDLGFLMRDRNEVGLLQLVALAGQFSMSLGETMEVFKPLAQLGFSIPSLPRKMEKHRITFYLRALLSRDFDYLTPHENAPTFLRLCGASIEWSLTLGQTWDIIAPLAALGMSIPELPAELRETRLDSRIAQAISRDGDSRAPWVDAVTVAGLLRASIAWGEPLSEVLQALAPLPQIDPNFPRIPGEMAHLRATPELYGLLSNDLERYGPLRDFVPLGALVSASASLSMSLGEVAELAKELSNLGLDVAEIPEAARDLRIDRRLAPMLERVARFESPVLDWLACTNASKFIGDAAFLPLADDLRSLGFVVDVPPAIALDLLFLLAQGNRPPDRIVTALDLARARHQGGSEPPAYIEALEALGDEGWEISDALAFANACKDDPAPT